MRAALPTSSGADEASRAAAGYDRGADAVARVAAGYDLAPMTTALRERGMRRVDA